jgi:hypothetical protein
MKQIISLRNTYNVANSLQLMEEFNKIEVNERNMMCSFHTNNMYTNTPVRDTMNIIKTVK